MQSHFWGRSVTSSCQTAGSYDAGTFARLARGTGVAVLMAGLAACSSAPDWAKPALIYGDEGAEAATADPRTEKEFPELADVPNEARPYSTAAERTAIAEGLANDRARARYTDEVLRGGTEPPAPAPVTSKPAPVTTPTVASPTSAAPAGAASTNQAGVIPPAQRNARPLPGAEAGSQSAEVPAARAAETANVSAAPLPAPSADDPAFLSATAAPQAPASRPASDPSTAQASGTAQVPSATPNATASTSRRAAVPAVPGRAGTQAVQSRASSGVDDRVSAVNQARAVAPAETPALAATPSARAAATPTSHSRDSFEPSRAPAIANEALEAAGTVVSSRYGKQVPAAGSADPVDPVEVNLDALRGLPAGTQGQTPGPGAALHLPTERPVASRGDIARDGGQRLALRGYSRATQSGDAQGGPGNIPPYVVNFGNGSTSLNVTDRHLIAEAADVALNTGRVVRVVGHASGIASNEDARARLANFGVSMDRATAVANELIRQGVAATQVIVEAKGASEPAFYETAPNGEAGNRRAEIFIE